MRRAQRKPSTSREKFGTLLRTHRNRLGISMIAFARAIGMDQGLLSRIERGQRPAPQIVPFVHRMALKLGFEKDSKYYKELIEAAYVSRFGTKRPAMSSGETAYHVMDVPPGSSGLAGLARQGPMVPWGIK